MSKRSDLLLDVDAPDKVVHVLRTAADAYYESAAELESAWQDKTGTIWADIAKELERSANKIEAKLRKRGLWR
jgi:hypothetical protein